MTNEEDKVICIKVTNNFTEVENLPVVDPDNVGQYKFVNVKFHNVYALGIAKAVLETAESNPEVFDEHMAELSMTTQLYPGGVPQCN